MWQSIWFLNLEMGSQIKIMILILKYFIPIILSYRQTIMVQEMIMLCI